MVNCVYALESPRWGDSNGNTQYTFMSKKIDKLSLLCLMTWLYIKPTMARTTPVSNTFHDPKGVRAIEVRLYFASFW